ncbi:hypothetical protein J6590_086619 [Homalodisca vitripennis]|nr:hypothetical protein J6590_086619 [Homalodisca vitripennis]
MLLSGRVEASLTMKTISRVTGYELKSNILVKPRDLGKTSRLSSLLKPLAFKINIKLLLFRATIRPVPSYTARAWYPKSSATRKRLEAFKNPTLLILTGSQWYARNAVILRTIGLPPTHNEPGLLDPLDY